ncbi:MAG TPA: hypothetical protein VJ909_06380 [Prolixibacteraceae bacterium]|nr:hypothetical protein [Prolixibacteraceae bacterium]
MKGFAFLIFMLLGIQVYAQISLDDVDYSQVKYRKVRHYIHNQLDRNVKTIYDIKPSVEAGTDLSFYKSVRKSYLIEDSYLNVWDTYVKTSPAESWEGRRFSFGMLVSPALDHIVYRRGKSCAINKGLVVYLELRFLEGIYRSAMAFEIINVNKKQGIIEFSYLEGNFTHGLQRLQFRPTSEGFTEIIHTSFYKSQSKFHDKILYPFFHNRVINEFHRRLRRRMKRNS